MKKKVICFDIDGVICKTKSLDYRKSKPLKKNIKKINELHDEGYYIKVFTARYMGRSNENIDLAKKKNEKITIPQLKKWGLKFNEIIFGKPSYALFIDDKNLFHKSNWIEKIDQEIKKIFKS